MSELSIKIQCVIFTLVNQQLQVLVENGTLPNGEIVPKQDKELELAVQRILKDICGVVPAYWEQVQTIGSQQTKQQWEVNILYYSLIAKPQIIIQASHQWVPVKQALGDLGVDSCLQRLHNKSLYTSLPLYLLPEEFTLTECQKTYESVLGFALEKKSFRRRLLDADCLEESGNIRRASHRPAQLYRLKSTVPYYFSRVIEGLRKPKISA